MKVLITSGGTREYIDDVRILTNVSSGRLGSMIADTFVGAGHEVYYIHSSSAILPMGSLRCQRIEANSVIQVQESMRKYVPIVDMVIHAMAVSDYYFEHNSPIKVAGNDVAALAEYIMKNAHVSPKIISKIKRWNPATSLVGFKFTVGKTKEELVKIAKESAIRNGCDIVIANDKKLMQEAATHLAYFVKPDGSYEPFYGKDQIAKGLLRMASSVLE